MIDCLFCRIVSGEIKAEVLHEDEKAMVFRDIDPQAPVHFLVVPVDHIASMILLSEQDKDIIGHMMWLASSVAQKEGLDDNGYRIIVNAGDHGGQEIHHLHIHVLGGEPLGPMRAAK